ncbi:DUF1588 domain-containing protein [Akkermansiaceae bacterium]|nr:DUF1588 domain-containing protein [Akkermansiaceae bacterium]
MKDLHNFLKNMRTGVLLTGCVLVSARPADGNEVTAANAAPGQQTLESKAMNVLETYCFSCHGPDKEEGDTRFDVLETVDSVDLQALFLSAQDAVHFEEMPPEDAEKQPTDAERGILLEWFKSQLTGDASKKLEEKMRRPKAGNYTDHKELFSGKHADKPGYTYDRRWLISEHIFNEKFNRILQLKPSRRINGKNVPVQGDSNRREIMLTNPFLMSTKAGVRYYADETLSGGTLLTMMTNAKDASAYMLGIIENDKEYLPTAHEMIAREVANRKTLESREKFLNQHIERVLMDLYGADHQRLLPKFVRVDVPPPFDPRTGGQKAPYHAANPGKEEVRLIYHSFLRLKKPGQSKEQLMEACEREWFNHGHSESKIQVRLTFLINYWDAFHENTFSHAQFLQGNRTVEYKPLAEEEMQAIAATIRKHRKPGDRYQDVIDKSLSAWAADFENERIAAGAPSDSQLDALIREIVMLIHEREPATDETTRYREIAKSYSGSMTRQDLITSMIQMVILSSDFVFRSEFGTGEPDAHGRRMLSPYDASYALAYALTDASPDEELAKAAAEGRLNTRADYEREVRRMLAKRNQFYIIDKNIDTTSTPSFTNLPIRELRFFREFFGYDKMQGIFKDNKRFGGNYQAMQQRIVQEADLLVAHILESDQKVIEKLLTGDEFYVYHSGDNEEMKKWSERVAKIYNHFKDLDWRNFTIEDLKKHREFLAEVNMRGMDPKKPDLRHGRMDPLRMFKKEMESFDLRLGKGQTAAAPYPSFDAHNFTGAVNPYGGQFMGPEVARLFNIDMADWDYPTEQPAKVENRKGILTHPAWLISFAGNFQTDPIHRGIWVQEKLLAGTIPDVPITVDAVIPEDPQRTMRQRVDAKTNNNYCMRCHEKINPLGLPFEMYDDFGRFRTVEALEYPENLIEERPEKNVDPDFDNRNIYKTLPIDAKGYLKGTGDSSLDGEVKDALDLIDRLAKSDRARQSIIRHAFRYFMGRNETLSDSKTLIDSDQTYLKSGGSFDELIVSLLTSDSFIYRKQPTVTE